MTEIQEQSKRVERLILELNKTGLSYLTLAKMPQSLDYFKKSEKIIISELKVDNENPHLNKLAGITFNNLACYYKKNNKPKVALGYLNKALQIQVYKVEDWISTASTHLNICAIYSFMQKHQEAAEHAQLSISMLQKIHAEQEIEGSKTKSRKSQSGEEQKSFNNLNMLAHYNLAVQQQYLKRYEQSFQNFKCAKQIALLNQKKNQNIILACQQSMERTKKSSQDYKKKLIELLNKKKISQQKGNYQFMRLNRKNFKSMNGDTEGYNLGSRTKKYEIYKDNTSTRNQNSRERNYTSIDKLKKLQPLADSNKPNQTKKAESLIKLLKPKQ